MAVKNLHLFLLNSQVSLAEIAFLEKEKKTWQLSGFHLKSLMKIPGTRIVACFFDWPFFQVQRSVVLLGFRNIL